MKEDLIHSIAEVRSKMVHACERSGRDPSEVRLLLASKTVEPTRIRDAFHAGAELFGENRVQEFLEKYPSLNDLPIEWHFIGQLQSNKVKSILPYVKLIHSLDRISLAEEIQKQAEKLNLHANVLIEINTSGETSKGGLSPDQFSGFIQQLSRFDRIRPQGIMTVPVDGNESAVRNCFQTAKKLHEQYRSQLGEGILSMGMSGDFEWAIEEGSTLVRVGSGVFGKRS
jgi:pyridoxal phosphate enzyme (YggS family)